ncbi:hypothetical protein HPB48_022932 [Haemaphysalis longicornis]|uniref:Reverse transcriptase domain-containing protein n=1 Tax=Haemaphysalis longicornis TaxID=44386 RepID=A0A9J6GPZ1_HAELO|nr:hypothetical protein HPB48_022932 [Haemaphysalis longicornis]
MSSPQGSPLSPLSWNITIAHLLGKELPYETHTQAFADDIVIIVQLKSRKDAEEKTNRLLKISNDWAVGKEITINNDKSQAMTIGKQYGTHPPILQIGSSRIKTVNEMKLLRVIIDNKLTFLPHLKYLNEKIAKITYNLNRTLNDDKSSKRELVRVMYKRGIERILTYAAPVWYTRKVTILRKLQAIQRLPLLMITKAFKITSNLSLNIMAKFPPVYLTIEKEIEQYGVVKEGKTFSCDDKLYTSNQIMKKYDLWTNHQQIKTELLSLPQKN